MNHNDFSIMFGDIQRDITPKNNLWDVKMVVCWKGKGVTLTIYQPPQMKGEVPIPGEHWYYLTIEDGQKSDKEIIKDTAMVDAVLLAFDKDDKTNVFARIMDADPKIENFIYNFSPRLRADAEGWKLKEKEKTELKAILSASAAAAKVRSRGL